MNWRVIQLKSLLTCVCVQGCVDYLTLLALKTFESVVKNPLQPGGMGESDLSELCFESHPCDSRRFNYAASA